MQEDPDVFAKEKQADEDQIDRTFSAVVEEFRKRYIEKHGIRSGRVMMQQIEKHLMPTLKNRDINSIRRKELTKLLDKIEDKHGPSMADAVLPSFRSLAKFHAPRDDQICDNRTGRHNEDGCWPHWPAQPQRVLIDFIALLI